MGKFTSAPKGSTGRGPITTANQATTTFEGAPAVTRDAKSDLFLLAVTNMVGEDTFYEAASDRDERFRNLVHQVAVEDFDWLYRFAGFLRTQMFMRSASIVLGAEAVRARLEVDRLVATGNVLAESIEAEHTNRQMIDTVIHRLDEPAEMLAYWESRYGRNFPKPVKRGVADAMVRLTTEYSAMKYDGTGRAWRLGDVLELVHPQPSAPWQANLFQYLLDRRHHPENVVAFMDRLPKIAQRRALEEMPVEQRREWLAHHMRNLSQTETSVEGALAAAGATWEWLSGWLPGGMDAQAWEAVIPSMGYMALLRNLRNFDQKGVSDEVADQVMARLADPEQVAKSMQFPFRFWSAHRAASDSMRWGRALSKALDLSTGNIPEFSGGTLILVDTSASMSSLGYSAKSTIRPVDAAGVFAAAVARKNAGRVDLVQFASYAAALPVKPTNSTLWIVERINKAIGDVGHGTDIRAGLKFFDPKKHKRVIVFSDMQTRVYCSEWPSRVPVYLWNVGGYAQSIAMQDNLVELGGMSDAAFRLVPLIEAGRTAGWPF